MKKIILFATTLILGISSAEAQFAIDAELNEITTGHFIAASTSTDIDFDITNVGTDLITTFDAEWTDGTLTYSETFPTSLTNLSSDSFTFTDQLAVAGSTIHNITVTITSVNGLGVDDNPANDVASIAISGLSFIPTKVVVGECSYGTWNGWCPRAWDHMDFMSTNYPNEWIGIMVHNADPLMNTEYDAWMSATTAGYPSGHVDRAYVDIDPSAFDVNYADRVTITPPADIQVTYVLIQDTVEITVTADFAANVIGDYRLNCVITESGIQDDSYDQANFYNTGNDPLAGYGLPWDLISNPASGTELIYERVARAILGGWDGEAGSVPSSVSSGDQISYTWSYGIPAEFDVDNMDFIGMLMDNSTGEILNASKTNTSAGLNEQTNHFNIEVYPNPFASITNIALELKEPSEVDVEVFTTTGQLVAAKNYGTKSGKTILKLDGSNLDCGIYFVKVFVNGQVITKRVTLTK